MDTIFALSSGRPPAAIAVVRLSGERACEAAEALAGALPPPRTAGLRTLRDTAGEALDQALVLVFPGPATATGEDVVELHCHGGQAIVAAVERMLATLPGLRAAEAGEFTRRALANGRIDLAEAEGLGDLLMAETEEHRRAAMALADGGLSRRVMQWLDRVAVLSAIVEAQIEYEEEGDVALARPFPTEELAALIEEMERLAAQPTIERLRDGVTVVIAGPPNSGKSSLLNALVDRDVAIVSPIAGTTRDRVERSVQRAGVPLVMIDTAGLTETNDPIEAIGVERARGAMAGADLIVWTGDDAGPHDALSLWTRADVVGREQCPPDRLSVSIHRPETIAAVWSEVDRRARMSLGRGDLVINQRHRRGIARAGAALRRAVTERDAILLAEDLRQARSDLSEVVGLNATETMLEALFSTFCIGK